MRAAPLLVAGAGLAAALLTGCGGSGSGAQPSASPAPAGAPVPSGLRVDSALCDDLREIVTVRRGAPALPDPTARDAADAAVRAAARRVLVSAEPSGVVPEPVVRALRELEAGAPPDDARDAVVAGYAAEQCPG